LLLLGKKRSTAKFNRAKQKGKDKERVSSINRCGRQKRGVPNLKVINTGIAWGTRGGERLGGQGSPPLLGGGLGGRVHQSGKLDANSRTHFAWGKKREELSPDRTTKKLIIGK